MRLGVLDGSVFRPCYSIGAYLYKDNPYIKSSEKDRTGTVVDEAMFLRSLVAGPSGLYCTNDSVLAIISMFSVLILFCQRPYVILANKNILSHAFSVLFSPVSLSYITMSDKGNANII